MLIKQKVIGSKFTLLLFSSRSCIPSSHSHVDMVRVTQLHVNTEFHSLLCLFVPEMTHTCKTMSKCMSLQVSL